METTLFRWIHLSDIHVGHGDAEHGWDQKLVMDALRRDIAAQVKKDQAPIDAVFVTGDIAFSGAGRSKTEYTDAKAWLLAVAAEAGVQPSQIFVVPGNHDVDRAADKDRNTKRLVEGLRSGSEKIDTAFADGGDRALLAGRMKAYLTFAADFAPAGLEERLFWVHPIEARGGLKIRLVGLNTSLLAADEQDHGKLRLGKEQIARALRDPIEEGELVMVLTHHPLSGGWLADEKEVNAWVVNRAHVHLSGHVHEADTEAARKGSGGIFVRIVAGSVHGDQLPPDVPASHGYSFGAIVLNEEGKPRLRVWPRRWASKRMMFILDAESVPDDERYAEHDVRIKLVTASGPTQQASTPAPNPRPIAGGPKPVSSVVQGGAVNMFISYCPEDDALELELEKHLASLRRKGLITIYSPKSVRPGEHVIETINRYLASAQVILLLLSPDYLASEQCYDVEVEGARTEAERRGVIVIPILLRPSDIRELRTRDDAGKEWFEKLQRYPKNEKPITSWSDRDQAFKEITVELRALAEKLKGA